MRGARPDWSRASLIFGGAESRVSRVRPDPTAWGKMANPLEFLAQVRAEGAKVTWPTRRETMITTALVLVMVVIASIFFVAVDSALRFIVSLLLTFVH